MKKKYREYYLHFKNNKLFRNTLHTYFTIACAVFLAYALVMVFNVYNAAISQMKTAQTKMLSQAETTTDYILRNVSSTAASVFENDTSAINAVTKPYDAKYSTAISDTISQMKLSTNAIDKVYFFNLKYDCIYTGENPAYTINDFPDKELLNMVYDANHYDVNNPHILKYETDSGTAEKRTLVSIYKYSDMSCMAVFIDSDLLNSMVNANSQTKKQSTTILQSDGVVISSSDPDLFGKNLSDNKTIKKLLSLPDEDGTYGTIGKIYCYRRSNTLNSLYVSSFNASSVIVSYAWQFMMIILFACLLIFLYFVSSMQMSISFFRPFKKLRTSLFDIMDIDSESIKDSLGTDDDLELISQNLRNIRKEYNSMQRTEYLYSATKHNELVYNILAGAYNYDPHELDEYNITLDKPYNTVVIIRLDNTAALDRSNMGLLLYGIENAGIEILTQKDMHAYGTVYGSEYDVVFLINHENPEFDIQYIQMLQRFTENAFNANASAAYNTAKGNIDSIADLYSDVKYAMQYRLVMGHSSIINYNSLLKYIDSKHDYPEKQSKAVIREINAKNESGVEKAIDEFIESVRHMSYLYIIVHSCVLMTEINSRISASNNNADDRDLIADTFMKAEVIEEIRDVLCAKAKDAIISVSDIKLDDKHVIIANSIEQYINEHYTDPNLSIDMIASYVNKSANYTRSIFKQQKNISISDYITKKRFDEVCRMLIETNLTAQAIAQQTGLSSGSYFYTAFKKYTGYTPDQFRKKNS